jgi:hypothetical protein
MNKIVEAVLYSEGSFWGERERFKFRTKIDNFTNTTDLLTDSERIVRTTFTVTMFGYIVPDAIIKQLSKKLSDKTFSNRQLVIDTDLEDTPMVIGGVTPAGLSTTGTGGSVPRSNVNAITIAYLNTNKAIERDSVVVPDTVLFAANFLAAPTGLPTTSLANFTFFINGNFVENTAIISFVDNGNGTSTLTINPIVLGYELDTNDLVLGMGKFN